MKLLYVLLTLIVFTNCASKKDASIAKKTAQEDSTEDVGQPLRHQLKNLGPQIFKTAIQSGQFLTTENGIKMVYTVVAGTPSKLTGFDTSKGELLVYLPLQGTENSWSIAVSTDGILYVAGGHTGKVFKHTPGSQTVEDLGKALPSENYVWEVVAGKDGEIFGCTYSGGRVFRYHPDDGFSDVGKGPIVSGQMYVRALAYSVLKDKIYAAVGSSVANLVELDPRTGAKTKILPEKYRTTGFVYPLVLVPDVSGEDRLFATVAGKTLIYNLNNSTAVESEISGTSSRAIVKSGLDHNKVYYTQGSTDLRMLDFSQSPLSSIKVGGTTTKALAMVWGEDNMLHVLNEQGKLIKVNSNISEFTTIDLPIPPQSTQIRLTAFGPDGKIHTSGYPGGGNGVYDPETDVSTSYQGLGQAESILTDGKDMYFNIYSGAHIFKYDTQQRWMRGANPKRLFTIPAQDRVFGAVSVPEHNSLFFGTVAKYGVLGGVLVQYDKELDTLVNYGNVTTDLSIISLLYKDNFIFGGTSIFGGAGISPLKTEAVLFVWDVLGGKKVSEIIPVKGKRQITNLIIGPDGNIWGVAEDTLFIYDPKARQVLSMHKLVDRYVSASWKNIELIVHPNGKVYGCGTNKGTLFSIDPTTMEITNVLENAAWLSMDKEGRFYFSRADELWQYIP